MTVSKSVAELLIVLEIYLAVGLSIGYLATPGVVNLSSICAVRSVVICIYFACRGNYLYRVLHRRNILSTTISSEANVEQICLGNSGQFGNVIPESVNIRSGQSLIVDTCYSNVIVCHLSTAARIGIATYTKPLCSLISRETEFALSSNSIAKHTIYINVCLAFFLVPNAYYVIILAGLGHYTTRSPNPVALAISCNIREESNLIGMIFTAGLLAYEKSCTATFVGGEEFTLNVRNIALIIYLEQTFYRVAVGNSLLEIVIIGIVYLEAGNVRTGRSSPGITIEMTFPSIVSLVGVYSCRSVRIKRRHEKTELRSIPAVSVTVKLNIEQICCRRSRRNFGNTVNVRNGRRINQGT